MQWVAFSRGLRAEGKLEPRYYRYAGLRIVSEIPVLEWAPFEQEAPNGDQDVTISLREIPDYEISLAAVPIVTDSDCQFSVPGVGSFRISHGREIVVTVNPGAPLRELRQWLIGSAWGSLCYQRGLFLMHSSAVMVGEQAVLFCASAKGGKSTLAARLNARGYPLISDDLCHLDIPEVGTPYVYPSAPRIKLWADTLSELEPRPMCIEKDPARAGKFHLAQIANTQAKAAPIRAIYLLEWGEFGISRLSGLTALRRLLPASTYRPRLLGSAQQLSGYCSQSLSVLQRVPLWELSRPNDLGAMGSTLDALAIHWANHRMISI